MKSKRLLAMLLTLCLILSTIAPAASAVEISDDMFTGAEQTTSETPESDPADPGKIPTLRDNADEDGYDVLVEDSTGSNWSFAESDVTPSVSLKNNSLSATLAELKEASDVYADTETVRAFVVMQAAPLADRYTSISKVGAGETAALLQAQDRIIEQIRTEIAIQTTFEVRYQFTYLTNAFSLEIEFGCLDEIAQLPGVKTVFLVPQYEPATTVDEQPSLPLTESSGNMTGVASVWDKLEISGQGMRIAIIDTGLDLDHPSFGALDPELIAEYDGYADVSDIEAVLTTLNAYKNTRGTVTAEDLYRSTKVPYAFNYVDRNLRADHASDSASDHGTHVAGIAAANKLDSTNVVGMAPDAQLFIMKVFGANGGAYADDIVASLEDAMLLDCDVVNASLGSPAGFSSSGSEELDAVYKRLTSQDIIAAFAAGNEGTSSAYNMWGTHLNRTDNPDNSTVSSPGTYPNTLVVASANNAYVMGEYLTLADGTQVFFMDSVYSNVYFSEKAGIELEYVVLDGLGYVEDYYDAEGNSLVEGKVVIVKRGTVSFADKVFNAQAAGAIAVLIWNQTPGEDIFNFGMVITDADGNLPSIPAGMITIESGELLAAAETKTFVVSEDLAPREDALGRQVSSFSSWGVTHDLRLLPEITGIGGNVYSCIDGGLYGIMSGTSMASPQVAGVSALMLQYLKETYPELAELDNGSLRIMGEAMLMSTATPIISDDSNIAASPRQQGSGLVNALLATTTEGYLTVNDGRPKAELYDNKTGVYSFTFEIHNVSDAAQTYNLSSILMTEDAVEKEISETETEFFMAGYDRELTGTVAFSQDSVTVEAGQTVSIDVVITLSAEDKAYFNQYWENGGYVEGYVYVENADETGVDLSMPFLGFYGSWLTAPLFDTAFWYDNSFWNVDTVDGLPEGDEYFHALWTDLSGTSFVLGFNPYAPSLAVDMYGNLEYDPTHNVISPNGDGALDDISEIYLSLLRNAGEVWITYKDKNGNKLYEEGFLDNRKTMYNSNYGQVVPWIFSWYNIPAWDFTDADGNTLPNDTELELYIHGMLDYKDAKYQSLFVDENGNATYLPVYIDTEAPELLGITEAYESGKHLLYVQVEDNHALASVYLMNRSGTQIYGQVCDDSTLLDRYGIAVFDVTNLGTEFMIAACDYGANEKYYDITYSSAGDNAPQMDTTKLYAYRTSDNYINSDHMFGWVRMDKPTETIEFSRIHTLSDDYREYAALNAAEYMGGRIFAIDAVGNFVVIQPGVWNRSTIKNLGINALDMTFDDSTDTLYVLGKSGSRTTLYTLDPMNGDLTTIKTWSSYTSGPWAITDDDNGTLYAIKYNSANIFTLTPDSTGTMTAVVDAAGTKLTVLDTQEKNVKPNYMQSIMYLDGILYWAYYSASASYSSSELISINTEDWTYFSKPYVSSGYDSTGALIDFNPLTELVGMIYLKETDWSIPASDELTALLLDNTDALLRTGESTTLKVDHLPWNYDLKADDIVWTSSDPEVATVVGGVITAIGEGNATITAAVGDVTATCDVIVVEINGHFYAYQYYSGDGHYEQMVKVDMKTMNYDLLGYPGVDFYAGDYNGHDGCFYGYDEAGQLYRFNMTTGECDAIGLIQGFYPADMAYDYSSGTLYALRMDASTGENTLYTVNMNNGSMIEVAASHMVETGGAGLYGLKTLACDTEGNLYAMQASGTLFMLALMPGADMGLASDVLYLQACLEIGDPLNVLQSMCWDHVNDVLLWGYADGNSVRWIDLGTGIGSDDSGMPVFEGAYIVELGDPTESGLFEYTGMFTIPAEIPELPEVAVEYVYGTDMLIFTGYQKPANVTVMPSNATRQDIVLTSGDESVVKVTEDGQLLGVAPGFAPVYISINEDESLSTGLYVTVKDCADNLYGHLLGDSASGAGQLWIELDPGNPTEYEYIESSFSDYVTYTSEYYDGKIYTYGYDSMDMEADWEFFIRDAKTYAIEKQINMGEGFPFVYDMTYDYATSTMYALAGVGETDADIYVMDMNTGALNLLYELEIVCRSIAAGPNGLYLMENSKVVEDDLDDPWATSGPISAILHCMDPLTGELTGIGSTGILSNVISSMTYDYDTNTMYWSPYYSEGFGAASSNCLALVDIETGMATDLGSIGVAGSQVGGLFTICENFPEEDRTQLHKVMVNPTKINLVAGGCATINVITMPSGIDADVTWESDNEEVATVVNGVVTAHAQGKAVITATITIGGVSKSASCVVSILKQDASFLTYNVTDGGWSLISRGNSAIVTNVTEGSDESKVVALTNVGEKIYGYDENGQLFELNSKLQRINIGDGLGLELPDEYTQIEIRDMAYDAANSRVLVLGVRKVYFEDYDAFKEVENGCCLYAVDLTTGQLTLVATLEGIVNVWMMDADDNGNVYIHTATNSAVIRIDLTTGQHTTLVNLRTAGISTSTSYLQAMYYDEITELLYLLTTGNGTHYRMSSVDPNSGVVTDLDIVGECVAEGYYRYGDTFQGLIFVDVEFTPQVELGVPTVTVTNNASTGKIVLSWDAVEGAEKYEILISSTKNGEYSRLGVVSKTTVNHSSAVAGETYYYRVRAIAGDSIGEASEAVGKTCDLARPVVSVALNSSNLPVLTWKAIAGADEYIVYAATSKSGSYSKLGTVTGTTATHKAAKEGTTYYYRVLAVYSANSAANSAASEIVSISVAASVTLGVPTVTAANNAATGKIVLTWDAVEGAEKYEILVSSTSNGTYTTLGTVTKTTATHSSATAGETYYYRVRAIAGDTVGEASAAVGKTCDLARPVVTVTLNSSGKPVISWTAIPGAEKYELYRSTSMSSGYTRLWSGTLTEVTNNTVTDGATYYYRVKAISSNSAANSAASEIVSITVKIPVALGVPTVTATNNASTGKVVLSWDAVESAEKYEILISSSENGTYTKLGTVTKTTATHSSATAGETYYYRVRAIAGDSIGGESAAVGRTCDLARPVVTVTLNSSGKPVISWTAIPGAVKYELYRSTSMDNGYTRIWSGTLTEVTNNTVTDGTTYYYRVKAISSNSAANSAASEVKFIMVSL